MNQLCIDLRGFLSPIGRLSNEELAEINKKTKANIPYNIDENPKHEPGSLIAGYEEKYLGLVRFGVTTF